MPYFVLLPLIVLFVPSYYLAVRFSYFYSFSKWGWFAFFIITILVTIVSIFRLVNAKSTLKSIWFQTAAYGLGFLVYLLLATLVLPLLVYLYPVSPATQGYAAMALALAISLVAIFQARQVQITHTKIFLSGLTNTIKVAHLSDTHLGHFRGKANLEKIVDKINAQKVEAIFFTGDFLDGQIALVKENFVPFAKLDSPVFFVEGNHDLYTGTSKIKQWLSEIGVVVLENEKVEWNGLHIIGLNHMLSSMGKRQKQSPSRPTIESTLQEIEHSKEQVSILLHHSPDGIEYANEAGIALYLTGHTHGGQLWPFTWIAKAMFAYNKGLHSYKNTQIYVSQGTGTFGPPMRLGTKSELAILHLVPKP